MPEYPCEMILDGLHYNQPDGCNVSNTELSVFNQPEKMPAKPAHAIRAF
jgi:hypothetical protein